MSWDCGFCSRSDGRDIRVDAVCHHCGVLLCLEHQYRHRWDTAVTGGSRLRGRPAVHCRRCLSEHHPRVVPLVAVQRR